MCLDTIFKGREGTPLMDSLAQKEARRRNEARRRQELDQLKGKRQPVGPLCCARCKREDAVEQEEVSGSSLLCLVCNRCGHQWNHSPKAGSPVFTGSRERPVIK